MDVIEKPTTSFWSLGALTICLSLNCTWAKCVVSESKEVFSSSCSLSSLEMVFNNTNSLDIKFDNNNNNDGNHCLIIT